MERKETKETHLYWKLFRTCFLISACTFGGGMVVMTMLQRKFVEEYGWIEQDEMMDLIAIAQSCPGVMAVNSSIIIGYRIAGWIGGLITVTGTVAPPMIILSIVSVFYRQFRDNVVVALLLKGMQAGVAAVMIHTSLIMCGNVLKDKRAASLIMLVLASIAAVILRVDIIVIILVCGVAGGFLVLTSERKGETV